MWKVKLDDGVWLAEGTTTTTEEDARLFPDMPSVQAQLKELKGLELKGSDPFNFSFNFNYNLFIYHYFFVDK